MVAVYVVGAGAVAVTSYWLLVRRARGKSLAFMGPRGSGKTTLATFLGSGEIPPGYRPTVMRESVKQKRRARMRVPGTRRLPLGIKMGNLALKLTMLDNPGMTPQGDKTNYGIWQGSATQVDAVLYLVDVSQLSDESYCRVAVNGAQHLGRWELGDRRKLLILTHTDLDPAWERDDLDEISGRTAVKDLRRELQAEEVLMGSLKDVGGTRDLAYLVLQFLAR